MQKKQMGWNGHIEDRYQKDPVKTHVASIPKPQVNVFAIAGFLALIFAIGNVI